MKKTFGIIVFSIVVLGSTAQVAEAQYRDSFRRSSGIQTKIDRLDEDPVENLPAPILFGTNLHTTPSNFGDPRGGGTRLHIGQDYAMPKGAPIVSPTDAVVTSVGNGDSSGLYVSTAIPGGERLVYMHLDEIYEELSVGDVLRVGDFIGTVGDTGNAVGAGDHLHLEMYSNRKAIDPTTRITKQFNLKETIDFVSEILNDMSSGEARDYAEVLVDNFAPHFRNAQRAGIDLPEEIEEKLGDEVVSLYLRDLTLNSTGEDVSRLQRFLITENSGSRAQTLAGYGATGFFGEVTRQALIEWQLKKGISPANGYFGPLTRSRVTSTSPGTVSPGAPKPSTSSPLTGTWNWVGSLESGKIVFPRVRNSFFLTLDTDSFGIKGDCNSIGGDLEISGNNITFADVVSTLMYCQNSDENYVVDMLERATSYTLTGTSLTLRVGNSGYMYFSK